MATQRSTTARAGRQADVSAISTPEQDVSFGDALAAAVVDELADRDAWERDWKRWYFADGGEAEHDDDDESGLEHLFDVGGEG